MIKVIILNRQRIAVCLVSMSFLFLSSGCMNENGNNRAEPAQTAPVTFFIAWHNEPLTPASVKSLAGYAANATLTTAQAESVDCSIITEIVCEVYDGSNYDLMSASFECLAHEGTLDKVQVGSNREFVILGVDAAGDNLYHGSISDITVVWGQTNDLGVIDVYPFYVSELLTPDDGNAVALESLILTWTLCETADKYRVLISPDESFDTLMVDDFTTGGSYVPSGLSPSATYYWKVIAFDTHDNHGPDSEEIQRFTIFSDSPDPERLWYRDADADGYGDPNVSQRSAIQPEGYVSNSSDCNDMDDAAYPGAEEVCGDGIDQDCNGDDLGCLSCADISGRWCGEYSEVDCNEETFIGSWAGQVETDCSFIAYSDWGEFMSGAIDPETLVLEATSDGDDCGPASIAGQWGDDFVSGSYTYAAGGSGTFTGGRCVFSTQFEEIAARARIVQTHF